MQHRVALVALLSLSCRKDAPLVSSSQKARPPTVCEQPSTLTPDGSGGSSSAIALGRMGKQRVMFLADEDDRALRVVDLDRRVVTATIALGMAPGHVLIAGGRVHVSLPGEDAVVELAPDGTECRRTKVPDEPIALAHDGRALLIASRRGHALTSVGDGKTTTVALSRDPTGILVEGRTAIVAHRAGSIVSMVSLDENVVTREISFAWRDRVAFLGRPVADMPRFAVQGHALARIGHRVMVPMVLAYPGDTHLEVTFNSGYGAPSVRGVDGYFPHEAAVVSFEPNGRLPEIRLDHDIVFEGKQRLSHGRRAPAEPPCLLPRSVAADGEDLVVACLGIDELLVHRSELELAHSERLRVKVPAGPTAVAIEAHEAVVWSQFARQISLVDLSNGSTLSFPVTASEPLDATFAEGRKTFHAPLGFDGRACASCHPDGLDDGLVWSSPHGPLQAPVLAARVEGTAPYGWLAGGATLPDHITETMKRIGGAPMSKETMNSLVVYLRALKPRAPRSLNALEKRGRTLFASAEVGCATCHQDGGSDGLRHDVGTGGNFDTPSLTSVGASAPYMHDGRFATLRQAIAGNANAMGSTKHLTEDDLGALVAYLKTL